MKETKKPNVDSESLVVKNPVYLRSNKSVYIPFDKCFDNGKNSLNKFIITKPAYHKKTDEICRYANVFVKYYDFDNELLSGLLKVKYLIDSSDRDTSNNISKSTESKKDRNKPKVEVRDGLTFIDDRVLIGSRKNENKPKVEVRDGLTFIDGRVLIRSRKDKDIEREDTHIDDANKNINYSYNKDEFISDILEYILTDTIIDKIYKMVDDYYSIDLTPDKRFLKNEEMHSLQFCNEHGRTIMALSIAYKLTIPIVCHYWAMKSDKMAERARIKKKPNPEFKAFIYEVFASYIPLFEDGFDMFSKLTITANSHLITTRNSDKIMWKRMENKKISPIIYLDRLVESTIVDLIPKAIFKRNIIHLIQVALPQQIKTMLTAKDPFDYCDISITSKNDELSGLEKMEANSARISDLDIILSKMNIKDGIKAVKKKFKIKFREGEIEYYKQRMTSFPFSQHILQFFAKDFAGICDLRNISRKEYIKLCIIFKRVMTKLGFIYIQHIMTGNISTTIRKRRISKKQIEKIESTHEYQKVMEDYSMGMEVENNSTIRSIAALINTPISYVDFDRDDRYGEDIVTDADIVASEFLRFVKML